MDKPREWWISESRLESCDCLTDKPCGPEFGPIHVIEYSAYEKLKAENWVLRDSQLRTYDGLSEKAEKYDEACKAIDWLERKLYDVDMPKEIFELKAKLAICTEALEKIRDEVGQGMTTRTPIWKTANEALEKLK